MTNKAIPLSFHYDFLPDMILSDNSETHKRITQMKAAGVSTVWLDNFIYGAWQNSFDEIRKAKRILEEEGFTVQALNVPLGHGGNALNGGESDPTIPLTWQNRISANGTILGTTTCVNDAVINDSRAAAEALYDMGFTQLFYDDDLRMGSWGPALQGCFCERCLSRLYKKFPKYDGISREEIIRVATPRSELWNAWCTIQCDSIIRFLDETTPDGMTPGIMVMHNGDNRHGIDILRIKEHFPHALFRVGEGHFDDASFLHPDGQTAIENSIKTHLSQIGSIEQAFSESTTYPVGALSPDNWIKKIKLEIKCGLRNIYLMSGLVFLTDPYWEALISAKGELEELALRTPLPKLDGTPFKQDFVWHL